MAAFSKGQAIVLTGKPRFAHWYSDTVRCPSGKILRNKDWGYLGTHEKDIFLTFEAGILVNERVVHNDASNTTDMGFDCDMKDYMFTAP